MASARSIFATSNASLPGGAQQLAGLAHVGAVAAGRTPPGSPP